MFKPFTIDNFIAAAESVGRNPKDIWFIVSGTQFARCRYYIYGISIYCHGIHRHHDDHELIVMVQARHEEAFDNPQYLIGKWRRNNYDGIYKEYINE